MNLCLEARAYEFFFAFLSSVLLYVFIIDKSDCSHEFFKQLVSEEVGLNLEKVTADMLGSAKKVTISKDDTIILDGGGDKKSIEERCEQVGNDD